MAAPPARNKRRLVNVISRVAIGNEASTNKSGTTLSSAGEPHLQRNPIHEIVGNASGTFGKVPSAAAMERNWRKFDAGR